MTRLDTSGAVAAGAVVPRRRPASSSGARDAVFAQLGDAGRAEQAARRMSDAIVLGVLVPGERLPSEAELARRFGVAIVTAREALGILRESGIVETRRGRGGGSFVIAADGPRASLVRQRLIGLSHVEISDLGVYVATIAAGAAERAAERASARDCTRLAALLDEDGFDSPSAARRNQGGFYLELAVLSQSTRLVHEQIRLQAEFGPLLWLSLADPEARGRALAADRAVVDAVSRGDGEEARRRVRDHIAQMIERLLEARDRVAGGGDLDG